uniref:Uncharacterized protein n=1 Tax=Monopterus albus TaxID=43700 RepID=A0A3Q3R720_MONAL
LYRETLCRSKVRLDGKTVLITGANTGIGKETALDMAQVNLACRDMTRARIAADEIRQKSGNDNVVMKELDLASLQSVRDLARDIQVNEQRLDILINNAGIMMCSKWKTEDGFEMQFGVNHLGHFLLTNCLLDLLKKSAPSRIVIVSSLAHEKGHFGQSEQLQSTHLPTFHCTHTVHMAVLDFIKKCKLLYTRTGVTVYSLHPGHIRTELGRHWFPTLPFWKRILVIPIILLIKNPWQGAQTTIYCAVDESLANVSGLYYSDCAPKTPAPQALNDTTAKKLWDLSASMVGLA